MGADYRVARRRARALGIAAATVLGFLCFSTPAAAADPSPEIDIYEAHAYRSLNDPGDLFVLIRYELPLEDAAGGAAWCAELTDDDGCDEDPPAPTAPASLPRGVAQISFYTDGADGTLEERVQAPRIDNALGGLYFGPGHGFTWADADIRICVESSATYFSPAAKTCAGPRWEAGTVSGPVAAAREALEDDLLQVMTGLQDARFLPLGTLVSNAGKITLSGRVFANEAFPIMDRVVAGAFQTGQEAIITAGYTPVAGDSALQIAIDATATASTFRSAVNTVGAAYFGLSGTTLLVFAVLIAGFAAGGFVYHATRAPVLASFAFFFPLIVGTWLRAPTIAVIFTIIAILTIPTAAMLIRKTPQ